MGSQQPERPLDSVPAVGSGALGASLVAWSVNLGLAGLLMAHPAICSRSWVSAVALVLLAGAWLLLAVRAGRQWTRLLPPPLPLAGVSALSLAAVLSLLANDRAPWPGAVLAVILFLLLSVGWFLAQHPGQRRTVTVGFLAAAAAAAGYGWLQHYGLDPLPPSTPFSSYRVVSVFDNPNDLGSLLAAALPLSLALFLHVSTREIPARPRLVAGTCALVGMVYGGLLLAASRGAWWASLAGTLVIAGFYGVQVARGHLWWRPIPMVALGLVLLAVTLELGRKPLIQEPGGAIGLARRALSSRFILRPYQETADSRYLLLDTSIGHRYYIWAVTAEVIRENPVLGVGFGDFGEAFRQHRAAVLQEKRFAALNPTARNEVPDYAHNEFLHLWAETGVCGLAAFLALAGTGLWRGLRRAWCEPVPSGLLAAGATASILATLLLGLVSYPLHLPLSAALFWTAIGFLWGGDAADGRSNMLSWNKLLHGRTKSSIC